MLTPEQIRGLLQDSNLVRVAERLDIHYLTLWRFMNGKGKPMYHTVKTLSDYIEGRNAEVTNG